MSRTRDAKMENAERQPIIRVKGLERFFKSGSDSFHALRKIDMDIGRGECIILKGVSGSGKTTLLSIIAGLDRPSSGSVIVEGEALAKLPDRHLSHFRGRHIGMIFQHYNLIENLSVRDNVSVPLIPMDMSISDIDEKVEKSMDLANISHKSGMKVKYISGGEKQRASIARAIVADPEIILCDEPTANLDKGNAEKFIGILTKLHSMGKTIIVATHDTVFEKLDFPFRTIEMEHGSIVGDD